MVEENGNDDWGDAAYQKSRSMISRELVIFIFVLFLFGVYCFLPYDLRYIIAKFFYVGRY